MGGFKEPKNRHFRRVCSFSSATTQARPFRRAAAPALGRMLDIVHEKRPARFCVHVVRIFGSAGSMSGRTGLPRWSPVGGDRRARRARYIFEAIQPFKIFGVLQGMAARIAKPSSKILPRS